MSDRYASFAECIQREQENVDFRVCCFNRGSSIAIVAPHGGGIEPGTSELAEAIAGNTFSLYLFEGLKSINNRTLHIASHRFDEPRCLALVERATTVVTVHGEKSEEEVVFLGGRDEEIAARITDYLQAYNFQVCHHKNIGLQGRSRQNICNRGSTGKGVQIEIARGLRQTFFSSLNRSGRTRKTQQFDNCVTALRKAIAEMP
ncbi:MAG: poly-gamma-glutamate hydrolase family protein [Cyanobacteria bacterium P01_D01_bin.123]